MSGIDKSGDGNDAKRHYAATQQQNDKSYDNKKQRQTGPDMTTNDMGRISEAEKQAMSLSYLAGLRSAAGFMANLPPQSFSSSMTNSSYFGNFVDPRLIENAKQKLRQGVDIARISNLFQSHAIPAGNTDFAFSPAISIPIARTMLNSNTHTMNAASSTLALNPAALNVATQGMNPMLSAVALLQGSQSSAGLVDPFSAAQHSRWSTPSMQQSMEQAVQSALENVRKQEQLQLQQASHAQELLQRYAAAADQSAVAAASSAATPPTNFNESSTAIVPRPRKSGSSSSPKSDGVVISIPEDRCKLNDQQVFLRQQIEAYRATEEDMTSHTRGRNKPVLLGQVGIRCMYCSHLPASQRGKGSTYFPSTLMGIYQAAQNMSVEHLQSGICTELPPDIRTRFLTFGLTKPGASVAGKRYWAETGKRIGLVDTEHGIRFAKDDEKPTIVDVATACDASDEPTIES